MEAVLPCAGPAEYQQVLRRCARRMSGTFATSAAAQAAIASLGSNAQQGTISIDVNGATATATTTAAAAAVVGSAFHGVARRSCYSSGSSSSALGAATATGNRTSLDGLGTGSRNSVARTAMPQNMRESIQVSTGTCRTCRPCTTSSLCPCQGTSGFCWHGIFSQSVSFFSLDVALPGLFMYKLR